MMWERQKRSPQRRELLSGKATMAFLQLGILTHKGHEGGDDGCNLSWRLLVALQHVKHRIQILAAH